eukprot:TRINITY_DN6039_c2_g1_i1.p1 TRINITY_DN6039_c2_g1~~TRINITY_DN6039_c2_g1_i1.p1  ORF type:complete len:434 (-),score=101.90 TRINITY_DN6039_c2_g1_i1:55-1356(-)
MNREDKSPVTDFLKKAKKKIFQLILSSRALSPNTGQEDKHFHIRTASVEIKEQIEVYKFMPMHIKIFLKQREDTTSNDVHLLEHWCIELVNEAYEKKVDSDSVFKKLSAAMRGVYSLLVMLPIQKLMRAKSRLKLSFDLQYQMNHDSTESKFKGPTRYVTCRIPTELGPFNISCTYLCNVAPFIEKRTNIIVIKEDYHSRKGNSRRNNSLDNPIPSPLLDDPRPGSLPVHKQINWTSIDSTDSDNTPKGTTKPTNRPTDLPRAPAPIPRPALLPQAPFRPHLLSTSPQSPRPLRPTPRDEEPDPHFTMETPPSSSFQSKPKVGSYTLSGLSISPFRDNALLGGPGSPSMSLGSPSPVVSLGSGLLMHEEEEEIASSTPTVNSMVRSSDSEGLKLDRFLQLMNVGVPIDFGEESRPIPVEETANTFDKMLISQE